MKKEKEKANVSKPEWISLSEKFGCETCHERCNKPWPNSILECKANKVTKIYMFVFPTCSSIPIWFLFPKVFYIFQGKYLFLPILISLVILFFYDMLFTAIEKFVIQFFKNLEARRKAKYEKARDRYNALQNQKKQEKEEAKQREKMYFCEVEKAKLIYKQMEKLKDSKTIRKHFLKDFEGMLDALAQIYGDLTPEQFFNHSVKNLFDVYLPELRETFQEFIAQYDKGILSSKDTELFKKLLKASNERFMKIKRSMSQQEKTDLYIKMSALEEVFSTSNQKEEEK